MALLGVCCCDEDVSHCSTADAKIVLYGWTNSIGSGGFLWRKGSLANRKHFQSQHSVHINSYWLLKLGFM